MRTYHKILCAALFLVALLSLLYPLLAKSKETSRLSEEQAAYQETVSLLEDSERQTLWDEACAYNERLRSISVSEESSPLPVYESMLSTGEDGTMGFITIPSLSLCLPIYHGTDAATLLRGVGHLTGSSLPVGGEGTHCVLSGHSGLSELPLFSDLEKLTLGDDFSLEILGQTLWYEVDRIEVVEPGDASLLGIEEGRDFVTLITCTPYGINSHRLLVRGSRISEPDVSAQSSAGLSVWTQHYLSALAVFCSIAAAGSAVIFLLRRRVCR